MKQDLNKLCTMYLEHCYYEKGLSENSLRSYRYDLRGLVKYVETQFCTDAANMDIERLDRDFWHDYMMELSASHKVKTVKRKLACFTGFFTFLYNSEMLRENPFEKLKLKLKTTRTVPETLSLKEIKKILDAAYQKVQEQPAGTTAEIAEFLHYRDIAVFELLFATGLRVQELCDMNVSAYDTAKQTIRVLGKGSKERQLYLGNEDVIQALKEYMQKRKENGFQSDSIFLNRWGKPLSCQAVRELVNKYCRKAGIKRKITPHAFRHTFASLLLEEGVEIRYIQEFLGHSSISTTQIYLHTSEKRKREILTKMHPRKKLTKTIK